MSANNFEELERVQEENQNKTEKRIFNFEKISCIEGFANEFPCKDYDLLSWIPLSFFEVNQQMIIGDGQILIQKREFVLQG